MNNKSLLLIIGAITTSIFLSMPKENGTVKRNYEQGEVLEIESYKVTKLHNNTYYNTDGKTYDVMIGDEFITFKNDKLNILESDKLEPQLMVKKKVNIIYPFSQDNPDLYDEYTLVIPKGYAYFANEIK